MFVTTSLQIFILLSCSIFESLTSKSRKFQPVVCVFQVQKLESDIMPLQQANSELSEKSGMLQAEKKILEEEIKRWKARTQVSEDTGVGGLLL